MRTDVDRVSSLTPIAAREATDCSEWVAIARSIVKHSEIGPGLLASMLKDLEIDRKDF